MTMRPPLWKDQHLHKQSSHCMQALDRLFLSPFSVDRRILDENVSSLDENVEGYPGG